MGFDLYEFNYLGSLQVWGVVFFACFTVGAVLTVLFAPVVAGRDGRVKLYRRLTSGGFGIVCWVSAAVQIKPKIVAVASE